MATKVSARSAGMGRVLVVVYAILALAATGRSIVQILTDYAAAPLAYSLSALAAVVYIVATVALIMPGVIWYRVAIATMSFELLGVLIVGTLSIFDPVLFPEKTMWSGYGRGYWFVPLVLPVLGVLWVRLTRPSRAAD
jgi:uncharacterized membrane protein YciS (DUF1049 family)